ncbi:hypothetical protein ACM61V_10960 [Sphingomonas sp. TX0543]|uniref:hypothetical protein n=1 Tax=unclassified Sphingomonas TaxID=196159 RepID=UPI0010F790A5|nr:hypothetical protein [Sphingomonas sp. 3P27F8]
MGAPVVYGLARDPPMLDAKRLDVWLVAPYVSLRMNLLLLLSALLSALTGVGARVVAPQAVPTMTQERVARNVPAAAVVTRAVRPVMKLPTLVSVAGGITVTIFSVRFAPAWLERRRE